MIERMRLMKRRSNVVTAMLLAVMLVVSMMPVALAAGTVDPENDKGTIELYLKASGMEATVYRIGVGRSENSNLVFELQEALKAKLGDVELNGLKAAEVEGVTKKLTELGDLEKLLPAEEVWTAEAKEGADKKHPAKLENMPVGVYLVVQSKNDTRYEDFDPFLLYLPVTTADGADWDNSVTADPKADYKTSGGGGGKDPTPPTPPTIIPDDPPPLVPGDPGGPGGDPLVEIPDEEPPLILPQTGLLRWPIPVMAMGGVVLVALGAASERKRKSAE